MESKEFSGLLKYKATLESSISGGSPAPADPKVLPLEAIELFPQVFQHREDSQWASDDHVRTLVKALRSSTKAAKKLPLEPLTIFWKGDGWALIDGHHRYKAYKRIERIDPVPVAVFHGSLDEAIGQALKGNSKNKLSMSKSEKSNAAWRLVISTNLSLNQMVAASTISKPTIILMRKVMRHLVEADPGVDFGGLTWQDAHRMYQGKVEQDFVPDPEWRDKRVAAVAQTLSETFGGEFKRKPEVFWEAVRKFDRNLTDHFLSMHGIDPEDYHLEESKDFRDF